MAATSKKKIDPQVHYQQRVRPEVPRAPWVLRVTEHTDKPAPVFIVKERIHPDQRTDTEGLVAPRSVLKESGLLYGPQLQRCLPIIRSIISRICDRKGIALELTQYLKDRRIEFRGNLPLDDDAGPKLPWFLGCRSASRNWTGWNCSPAASSDSPAKRRPTGIRASPPSARRPIAGPRPA